MTESVGWIVTCVAVGGVLLNNHRRRECFMLWLFSNAGSCGLHLAASMWALVARDLVFFVLAIHGLAAWRRAETR